MSTKIYVKIKHSINVGLINMNKIYTFKYKMLFLILIFSIFISGCNNGPDKEESNTSEVSNIEESDAPKAPDVVEDIVSEIGRAHV